MKDHRPKQPSIIQMNKQSTTLFILTLVTSLAVPSGILAISPISYTSSAQSSKRLTDLIFPQAILTDAAEKISNNANTNKPEIILIAQETGNSSSEKTSTYSDDESATSPSSAERPSAINTYSSLWRWFALLPFLAVYLGSFLNGDQEDAEYVADGTSGPEESSYTK